MPNINKIKGRIIEIFGSYREFAKAAGISYGCLCYKFSGQRKINCADISKWTELLDIKQEEIGSYFFEKKVKSA